MSKIFTPSSWGKRAEANFRRARRKRLVEMADWVGVPEKGTKWIVVFPGRKAIVDEEDYEFLNQWNWTLNNYGYAVRRESVIKTSVLMHRVIMGAKKGTELDYINHIKLDNRKTNLRFCTTQENQFHRLKSSGTSKFKGVSYCKRDKNWIAFIKWNKKTKNLGRFESELDAAKAYNKWALKRSEQFSEINLL